MEALPGRIWMEPIQKHRPYIGGIYAAVVVAVHEFRSIYPAQLLHCPHFQQVVAVLVPVLVKSCICLYRGEDDYPCFRKPFRKSLQTPGHSSSEPEGIIRGQFRVRMPSGAALLAYRSNIPYLSDYCLSNCDKEFPARAKAKNGGFIVAGSNYGQGSSREHAALVPLQLGIKAVVAKSFARIHKDNLMNNGILPLVFADAADYDKLEQGDSVAIYDAPDSVKCRKFTLVVENKNLNIPLKLECGERQQRMLLCGGSLRMASGD